MHTRLHEHLLTVLLAAVLAAPLTAQNADDTLPPDATRVDEQHIAKVQDAMAELTQAFETLENLAQSEEPTRPDAARAADSLIAHARALATTKKASPSWAHGLTRVQTLARRVRDDIGEHRLVAAHENLVSLRRTCVACHVRFQDRRKKHSMVPATGNTLFGRLELLSKDGKPRDRRDNVVVFLDSVPGKWRPLANRQAIVQKNRAFLPEVLPIVVGGEVAFPNDDLILHNVFSLSKTRSFDLGMYRAGKSKTVDFPKKGLVRVYCNIHPDMAAHIVVLGNPFFVKTGPDGEWALTGIPDGSYDLRAWSRFGGHSAKKIRIEGSKAVQIDITVRDTKSRITHKNKFGRAYRGKYSR